MVGFSNNFSLFQLKRIKEVYKIFGAIIKIVNKLFYQKKILFIILLVLFQSLYTLPIAKILSQKCADMDLNGFILKKINENENIKEKKNPGSRFEVTC